jgi:hypothetical protein
MRCVLCDRRKGKRSCPAKSAVICAQCCGEKRILEIDCPESCEYLRIGRNHEAHSQRLRHLVTPDAAKMEKRRRVFAEFEEVVAQLEYFLAEERHSVRDLKDRDVAEALDLLLATLRTEANGILYERVSNDLRVDSLRRRMKELLDRHLEPREEGQKRLRLSDAIDCLEAVREILASHMEAGPAAMSYVDFLARMLPRRNTIASSGSSLIIPGR